MQRLTVLLLLVSAPALAAGPWQETQPLSRAAPAGAPTDQQSFPVVPMSLDSTARYRVTLCAEAGATLAGTGSLRLWLYHPRAQSWGFNASHDLAVTTTGARCQSWGRPVDVSVGYLLPAVVAVGVSAGNTVTLYVDTVATR